MAGLGQSAHASTEDNFDFVVAGAGHNSLTTAAYLAKGGFSVLVLEGREQIGGGAITSEVCLPGFKEDVSSTVHIAIQQNPMITKNELGLLDMGLEYIDVDPIMHAQFLDGTSITQWLDLDRTCAEYAKFSKKDAETYRRMVGELEVYLKAEKQGLHPPNMGIWLRRMQMSGYDLTNFLFESEQVRTFHLSTGHFRGVPGSNPGTGSQAFSNMFYQILGRPIPRGGSGVLSDTLGEVIENHGGLILTNKSVKNLIIENNKCKGVECSDGSQYRAKNAVVSTIHVKDLVKMAPDHLWGEDFVEGIRMFRPEIGAFAAHYAMKEAPKYPLADGGSIVPMETAVMSHPERVFTLGAEDANGEIVVEGAPMQITSPSVSDPTRAPEGFHTTKYLIFLPYGLREGPEHWDTIKDDVEKQVFKEVLKYAPNMTEDKVLAKFVTSPLDIERMNPGFWRGSVHGGDIQIEGEMRPAFGWHEYKMPIPGLYQTGATTNPGGSISGLPGRNAAEVILKDFGSSLEEVVANA